MKTKASKPPKPGTPKTMALVKTERTHKPEVVDENEMSEAEQDKELQKQVRLIRSNAASAAFDLIELAAGLWEIKRLKLYRRPYQGKTHKEFRLFCEQTLHISGDHANNLIAAREAFIALKKAGKSPPNELSFLFAYRGMESQEIVKAFIDAEHEAETSGHDEPTKDHHKQAAAKRKRLKAPPKTDGPSKARQKEIVARLNEIQVDLNGLSPGGYYEEDKRKELLAEAAELRAEIGVTESTTTVDTGSPPPPIDTEAEEPWTVARIHETIDEWFAALTPETKPKKLPDFVEQIKGLFK